MGSGVTFGKYENKAVANYFDTQWKTSNVAKETVLVVPDPLFDLGTIIGKVFDDSNGNGMQDDGENGIGHARIIMEDGTIVVTDKDGKYHVPGVIPGTHLLRLVSVPGNSENSNKSSRKIDVSENPKVVRVTEGLLCKVNFGVIKGGNVSGSEGKGSDVTEGEPDLTILALGEGVAGYNNSTGNLDPVAHDDAYDDGFYSRGRMAYYLKYTTDNRRYRVTSSFDSKRNRYRELYRYIDPDKYYPNYGDDSTISWDATNTQGLLYLKGEHLPSNSSFLLGNYQTDLNGTELLNYNRTLYGVEFKLNNNVSGQGEYFLLPNTGVKLFGAQAYQIAAHNELKATGGSFYYLKHNNIVAGSERVSVEVRDKVSNMMLSRVTKVMGIDYEIDYGNGRIMFNYPIQSVESSDTIISTGILDGSPVYVVVDYEYEPDRLHLNEGTYGGRIEHSPTKDIKIGVSAVSEEEDDTDYMLQGADIKWSLPKDTTITGEYAESESRGIPNHISLNGGLSFDTVTNGPTTEGSGYQVRVSSKPLEKVDTGGYYQRLRPGFISSGTFIHQGTEKYGFNALTRLTDELSVLIKYDAQELLRQYNLVSGALVGGQKTRVTSLQGIYQKNRLSLTGEYRYQSVEDTLANTTSESNRDTALGALRAGYKLTDKFNLYMEQQATLKGDTNHQTTLGASAEVMKGMHTNLQGTSGTTGNSVLLGITSNVSEKTNVFTNFSYGVTSGANPVRTTTTTGGLSSQLTPETRVYVQEQYQTSPSSVATAEAVGQESSLDDKWRLGCSFERGMVNNFDGTDTVRKSGSINLGYNDKESLVFGTKLEGRLDEGVSDRTQYTTSNDIKYKLTHDFSILGRLKWSRTENDTTDEIEGLFKESGVGLAFRPVSWDKLNLIGKYTYLIDQHPQTKLAGTAANIDPLDITKERASVYALEGAYDLPWCQVVGKYAFKNGQEKVGGRAYTDSDTILWISRINYHVINKWDAGVEYRVLEQKLADDKKTGMLVEAMYKINEYAQLGIGYNFTDFTDDLINDNDYKVTGPFIRFVGTFSR
ncbi:MAG: hypothetical protein HY811_04530 [Planctomycetes bacterium]|nr:hypothetical protein [Planctomycetota bacterium]